MRKTFILPILILISSFSLQAASHKTENNFIGNWKLVKAETNGKPNPQVMMDRTFRYDKNGTFEGKIYMYGKENPFNRGMYYLPNDTTMICIHFNPDGKLAQVAFTYNFHVKEDTFHIYGVYFTGIQSEPGLLQMNYIDEWWKKIPLTHKNK